MCMVLYFIHDLTCEDLYLYLQWDYFHQCIFSHVPILYMKALLAKLQIIGETGNHMFQSLKMHSELLFLYFQSIPFVVVMI